MTRENSYLDRKGREFDLSVLDEEERRLIADLRLRAEAKPNWAAFEAHWLAAVAALYDARGLSRKESRQTAVYQIAQDLSSRLAVAAGLARAADYRDDLEELVRSRFGTRRAFCEATGLSEDMVSHVLARRKHLAIDTLTQALRRIGCALHIVPVDDEGNKNGHGRTGNGSGRPK